MFYKEYLTGALADGGNQDDTTLSIGNYRSATRINDFNFGNVASADALSGQNYYFATCIRNETDNAIMMLTRQLDDLGRQVPSDLAQLGASGSGTLSSSNGFKDWPDSGWCRITQSNGTYRETVYYSSRTN